MPSVRDIAEHANVSISTVSLVINNKPGVSRQMRQRVLTALQFLREKEEASGYTPGSPAHSHNNEFLSIVVLHPAILRSSQVFSEFMRGIQDEAARHQIQLRLAVHDTGLPNNHISNLYFSDPELYPDGVLVIGHRQDVPLPEKIFELGTPCVLVGRSVDDASVSSVGRNEMEIAEEATRCLIELGHRAIAFIGGEMAYSYTGKRLMGYRQAMQAHGLPMEEAWIALGDAVPAAEKILDAAPEVTAGIFINDAYAVQALPIFQQAGYRIPQDFSAITFDDTHEARNFDPPLTSVTYPRYQEGMYAVRLLVEQINNPLIQNSRMVFRASLIDRDSCTAPGRRAGSGDDFE